MRGKMDNNREHFDTNQNGNRTGGNNSGNGNNGRNPNSQGNSGQDPRKQNLLIFLVATLISLVLMSYFMKSINGATSKEVPYDEFVRMLEAGKVESVYIASDRIQIEPTEKQEQSLTSGGGMFMTP